MQVLEVMVEGKRKPAGQWMGRTSQNKMVNFTADAQTARPAELRLTCVITTSLSQQPGRRIGDIRSNRSGRSRWKSR